MKLFLAILEDEHDEGTVISPILIPAVDADAADRIAAEIAERLGVDLATVDPIGEGVKV